MNAASSVGGRLSSGEKTATLMRGCGWLRSGKAQGHSWELESDEGSEPMEAISAAYSKGL